MAFYSTVEYWNERYATQSDAEILEDSFDWYLPYGVAKRDGSGFAPGVGLREELLSILPATRSGKRILVVGCGTSLLGEQLSDDGWDDVTCVDSSDVVVRRMQRRAELLADPSLLKAEDNDNRPPMRAPVSHPGLRYLHLDAECLQDLLPAENYDAVIDKAMLDAALCGDDPSLQHQRVSRIVIQLYEVLRPGGVLLHVTSQNQTSGPKGVLFRNPAVPWKTVAVTKLELNDPTQTMQMSSSAKRSPAASSMHDKPYWLFQLVK
jgi:SAM-dependent methyltransferase